ncbi:MAG: helix-turn-helix domain-containing protein [Chthoniobacter sp.]
MPNLIPAARSDCPLTDLVDMIGGRWKVLALWRLIDGTKRFSELRHLLPGVTQKMLTQQLRQLEKDGLISRKVFPQVPPKVEYRLTGTGEELCQLLITLSEWAKLHMPALQAGKLRKKRAPQPARKMLQAA